MTKLEWGGQPPEGYTGPAWGARAIYSLRITGRSVIDLVWDRQSAVGDPGEVRALCSMLDTRGLDMLREACTSERLRTDEHRAVRVEVGDYVIEANPRESCGYLYIVAYRRPCLACRKGVPESRVYAGVVGPFCDTSCRERYLSRPTTGEVLAAHTDAEGNIGPIPVGELANTRPDTLESYLPPLRKLVKPIDLRQQSIPFEPAAETLRAPYKCNVPMCGESGVCGECRKRGAR